MEGTTIQKEGGGQPSGAASLLQAGAGSLSDGRAYHFPAGLCAVAAGFCTFPAVFRCMFATLLRTGKTGIRTDLADLFRIFSADTHDLGGRITNCGTFHVQLDTAGHHLYIFFLETGRSAVITERGTPEAGLYACFKTVITGHNNGFLVEKSPGEKRSPGLTLPTIIIPARGVCDESGPDLFV